MNNIKIFLLMTHRKHCLTQVMPAGHERNKRASKERHANVRFIVADLVGPPFLVIQHHLVVPADLFHLVGQGGSLDFLAPALGWALLVWALVMALVKDFLARVYCHRLCLCRGADFLPNPKLN
jgi:hypothetical protein